MPQQLEIPDNLEQELEITGYDSVNIRVKSPEGTFYFDIYEDRKTKKPVGIIGIGPKSGSPLSAWLDAFCRVASRQMERGFLTVEDLKVELSSTRSDKTVLNEGIECTSGPEALFIALCKYTNRRYEEMRESLGINERMRNGPSLNRND